MDINSKKQMKWNLKNIDICYVRTVNVMKVKQSAINFNRRRISNGIIQGSQTKIDSEAAWGKKKGLAGRIEKVNKF